MRRTLVFSAAALVATAGMLAAADFKSGLQPGEKAGAFNVKDCTGPNAGKSLCYR